MSNNKSAQSDLLRDCLEIIPDFEIQKELDKNNVITERVRIIRSFVMNLCYNVTSTYFGNKFIKTQEDIESHYKWAFNKTCGQFLEQDIDFRDNVVAFDYFNEYFYVTLYENEDYVESHVVAFWEMLFKFHTKTRNDLNIFIDIYDMFNNTFENKINYEPY